MIVQVLGGSEVINGGIGNAIVAAAAADTAAVASRSIDFTLDGKEGLFQVPVRRLLKSVF